MSTPPLMIEEKAAYAEFLSKEQSSLDHVQDLVDRKEPIPPWIVSELFHYFRIGFLMGKAAGLRQRG